MQAAIRNAFVSLLARFARGVVRRYQPKIVMVTGSVGKTSTKDAIAAALSGSFDLRKSEKSFNSEIGVPLTILGVQNPWSNPFAWLGVFIRASWMLLFRVTYPKLLVLEVGADKPGDLEGILKIAKPDAVVVTLLPAVPVHVQFYESPAAVREEEFVPAAALPAGAPLVVSADDTYALELAKATSAKVSTFGYAENADVRITGISVSRTSGVPSGMQANLSVNGASYPISVSGMFGRSQLYAPAAGVATALALGASAADAIAALSSYEAPPGRGKLFSGIKESILIDDSYNASPVAVEESLKSLSLLGEGRKVAILGDMRELGEFSESEHMRIGALAAASATVLITVGEAAKDIARGARNAGMAPGAIHEFATSAEAAVAISPMVQPHDTILVKGSQGIRLERIVAVLLANDSDRDGMVRQDSAWERR